MPFTANQHPRLYFSSEELPAMRESAKHGVRAEVLSRIVAACERLIDPSDESYLDYRERSKPIWRERKGIFVLQPSLLLLSFGYGFTGDERYGVAARDTVIALIESKAGDTPAVSYGNQTEGWRHGLGHDKFNYAWMISAAYDICYELFSEQQRQSFIDHALESIALIRQNALLFEQDIGQMINNRGSRGLLSVCGIYPLVLEGDVELPQMDEYMGWSVAAVEAYLHTAFDQDGVCFEGPSYGNVLHHMYYFCRSLARSGRINLLCSHRWEKQLHHLVHELLPGGGSLNDLNDCSSPCGTVAPLLFLMNKPCGAIIPWLAPQLDLHPLRIAEIETNLFNGFFGSASPIFIMEWRVNVPLRTPEELGYPKSRLFPHRGIASMRTGWGSDDVLLSHRCGLEIGRLHRQSDQNHLSLYALGEKFLVDEGYGQPGVTTMAQGDTAVNRYFSQSDVHNTVLIDGRGQNGNQIDTGWAEGRLIDWQHTPQFDTTLGDASEAYGENHAIERALRRVVFVRDTPQPFLIVIDDICVGDSEAHRFEVLWRTAVDNCIETDGSTFCIIGKENDCYGAILFSAPAELETRVHYNWPQLRVITTTKHLQMATLLMPIKRGSTLPRASCEQTETGDFSFEITDGKIRHNIRAGALTTGPLQTPISIEYQQTYN